MQVPDDELVQRVINRRMDPVTGKIYNARTLAGVSAEVAGRLVQRADDTEDAVRNRLATYQCARSECRTRSFRPTHHQCVCTSWTSQPVSEGYFVSVYVSERGHVCVSVAVDVRQQKRGVPRSRLPGNADS